MPKACGVAVVRHAAELSNTTIGMSEAHVLVTNYLGEGDDQINMTVPSGR
ncbi:hypothetical protein [Celeribacter sp.]